MLKLLKSLVLPAKKASKPDLGLSLAPPAHVEAAGGARLELGSVLRAGTAFPVLDWDRVQAWVNSLPDEAAQAAAWSASELAWMAHLRAALGGDYLLRSQGSAVLLSTLPEPLAAATLDFVNKTVQRVLRVLEGVAEQPAWGHDLLIVFEDEEAYYRYVAHYYPEAGEFAASSGMYINHGCGHFVTVKDDLRTVEPVIAHELTHACLSHLPIPAWLNEGLAVNTEHRLCPPLQAPADPWQLHARHRKFWGPAEIQEFWSGKSFLRTDEGNELSYDLARILVSQFAADWERFRPFAAAANLADAAAAAAEEHLGIELGAAVCAVLQQEPDAAWSPRPEAWKSEPERGAF